MAACIPCVVHLAKTKFVCAYANAYECQCNWERGCCAEDSEEAMGRAHLKLQHATLAGRWHTDDRGHAAEGLAKKVLARELLLQACSQGGGGAGRALTAHETRNKQLFVGTKLAIRTRRAHGGNGGQRCAGDVAPERVHSPS